MYYEGWKAFSCKAKSRGFSSEILGMKPGLAGKKVKREKFVDKVLDKKWHEKETA